MVVSLALEEWNAAHPFRFERAARPLGRGWIGITPRGAYETLNLTQTPILAGLAGAAC